MSGTSIIAKISISLKGDCTGWYESIHVKIPQCWKSQGAAHVHVKLSSWVSVQIICVCPHHLPYFVYMNCNGSDETSKMCGAAAGCRSNMYQNHMCWHLFFLKNCCKAKWSTVKTYVKRLLSKRTKIVFQDRLLVDEGQKYCRKWSILQYF